MKKFPDANRLPVVGGDIYMYVDPYTNEYVRCELIEEFEDRYKLIQRIEMGTRSFVVKKPDFYLSPDEFRVPKVFYKLCVVLIIKSEDRRGERIAIENGIV